MVVPHVSRQVADAGQRLVCQRQLEEIKCPVTDLAVTVIPDGIRAAADKEIFFSLKFYRGAQPFQALQLIYELPVIQFQIGVYVKIRVAEKIFVIMIIEVPAICRSGLCPRPEPP